MTVPYPAMTVSYRRTRLERRHLIEQPSGKVDETPGGCPGLLDVVGGDLWPVRWRVLRVMPTSTHSVELAQDAPQRRIHLRPGCL